MLDTFMKNIRKFWDKDSKFIFIASIISMAVAHGFSFASIFYSHDSLSFALLDGTYKVTMGRWLYPLFINCRLYSVPWLVGIISTVYVSIAVLLVYKLLEFNKVQGICLVILFTTNITLTSLFASFIFDTDADCMALLMACFAVYAFKKFPKYLRIIVPVISLILSMALYQAYIGVAAGLFLILLIKETGEITCRKEVKESFIFGIKELLILAVSSILYAISVYCAADLYGIQLVKSYNGAGMLEELKISDILAAIPNAYIYVKDTFFDYSGYNLVVLNMVRLNNLLFLLLIASVILFAFRKKGGWGAFLIIVPGLIILPLAVSAIYLVSFGTMHQLMTYAFNLLYLLPIVFINMLGEEQTDTLLNMSVEIARKAVSIVTVILICVIGFENIVYSNGAYVYRKLVYDNTLLHAQTVWYDVNNLEGYVEGETGVIFMGYFTESAAGYSSDFDNKYIGILSGATDSSITYNGTAYNFYSYILGRGMVVKNTDSEILSNEEFISMPLYPQKGYCKIIDGNVYVKMSE